MISALAEHGLILRTPDPEDGRSALVALTPSGAAALRRLRGRKNAYLARRLRGLEAGEVAVLTEAARLLERLLDDGGRRGDRG
jgi:DNA-binding MarR family transcriptional regulator